jgi:methylenetetrahydrofolate reductase (NADPH)
MQKPLNLAGETWRKRLIGAASLEITARDSNAASALREHLPGGARVHITHLSSDSHREIIAQAKELAMAGLQPIPHLAARNLRGESELGDYIARLVGEAGVTRVLLVAGDLGAPRGPFAASLDVLETGLLEARGVRGVSFAVHPEGHPSVPAGGLGMALSDKLAYAARHGLEAEIISQFCFEAAPILHCIRGLRSGGVATPVRIGAAAPTNTLRMMKFALRCGIGPSLRALEKHGARFGEVLTTTGPEALVADLAEGLGGEDFGAVLGMHFFVFGGIKQSAEWLQQWRGAHSAKGV